MKPHLGGDLECQVPLSPVLAPDTSHLALPRIVWLPLLPLGQPLQQAGALSPPPIGSRLFPCPGPPKIVDLGKYDRQRMMSPLDTVRE